MFFSGSISQDDFKREALDVSVATQHAFGCKKQNFATVLVDEQSSSCEIIIV